MLNIFSCTFWPSAFCFFHHPGDTGHSWKAGNPRVCKFCFLHVACSYFPLGHARPSALSESPSWSLVLWKAQPPPTPISEIFLLSWCKFQPFLLFLPKSQFLLKILQIFIPSKTRNIASNFCFPVNRIFPRSSEDLGHSQLPDQLNGGRNREIWGGRHQ